MLSKKLQKTNTRLRIIQLFWGMPTKDNTDMDRQFWTNYRAAFSSHARAIIVRWSWKARTIGILKTWYPAATMTITILMFCSYKRSANSRHNTRQPRWQSWCLDQCIIEGTTRRFVIIKNDCNVNLMFGTMDHWRYDETSTLRDEDARL